MTNKQRIDIPDIGPVTIRFSGRARYINIRLKPSEGIILTLPYDSSVEDGISFLKEKKAWVKSSLARLAEKEQQCTLFDEQTNFKTRSFALRISSHAQANIRIALQNGVLRVYYPANRKVTELEIQETIRYGIEEALRLEAKRYLPMRLDHLARRHGIPYAKVTIKNLKTRWGSCSAVNNINLNLHLMRLPDALIDYVLLHELCHVHEKNHGPHFWRRLDRMCNGRARELDTAMKDYRTKIY
ncbi:MULTISPECIES: M48 family metallopeptidase [unclassified Carboxylicivirga]|uniref:M48 family metallopeptidase n=1 Tax=Carboxylicivirga TaxID=1628153 RepID=UPI003D333D51